MKGTKYNYESTKKKERLNQLLEPTPEVVVVSGGPCGGKTTLIESLPAAAEKEDRELVVLPEVATRLLADGVDLGHLARHDRSLYMDAQRKMVEAEANFITEAKERYKGTNALIILDRSINDSLSYMSSSEAHTLGAEFDRPLSELGYDLADKVIYLPSLASSNPAAYELLKSTNPARWENATEAATSCAHTLEQWSQHPELHIVDSPDFSDKLRRATQFCLGGDNEFEQKWQVDHKAADALINAKTEGGDMLNMTLIVQQYGDVDGLPIRLRRGITRDYEYFHLSVKEKTAYGNKELRRTISKTDYDLLTSFTTKTLMKVRYAFRHTGQLWHADVLVGSNLDYRLRNGTNLTWFFEAEVAEPKDFESLELPISKSNMRLTDVSNKDFARIK